MEIKRARHFEDQISQNQELTYSEAKDMIEDAGVKFTEELKDDWGLIDQGKYTILALLFSDQNPYLIRQIHICKDDTESTSCEFTGSVLSQIRNIRDEFAILEYPMKPIIEVLTNSILHRDYEIPSATLIRISDDRVEIITPGGLIAPIEVADLTLGVSVLRNPKLGKNFASLRLANNAGLGIPTIMSCYRGCQEKPVFVSTPNFFSSVLPVMKTFVERVPSLSVPQAFSKNEVQVLLLFKTAKTMTCPLIMEKTGLSQTTATRVINSLIDKGKLFKIGAGKRTIYSVMPPSVTASADLASAIETEVMIPGYRSSCSPLRYPGSKAVIAESVADIISQNKLRLEFFIEPFAGGASVGLMMLLHDHTEKLILNDRDAGVCAFWNGCLFNTDEFCRRVEEAELSLTEWDKQKEILYNSASTEMDRGFAFFYQNRTNYNGVLLGGPLGGRDQSSKFTLGCRYNKRELLKRIRLISQFRDRIIVSNLDGISFLDTIDNLPAESSLLFVDPPYTKKADGLYAEKMTPSDHRKLAASLSVEAHPWILTYNDARFVRELYKKFNYRQFPMTYSAKKNRKEELMFLSPGLSFPPK